MNTLLAEEVLQNLKQIFLQNASQSQQQRIESVAKKFLEILEDLSIQNFEYSKKYEDAPGAKKHHHNYKHGLLVHSATLAMELAKRSVNIDLTAYDCAIIAFAHDLCKVDTYYYQDGEICVDAKKYKHHARSSVRIAKKLGLNLTSKQKVCILWHMGKWGHFEDHVFTYLKKHKYVEAVIATQQADMAACTEYDNINKIIEKHLKAEALVDKFLEDR